MVKARIPGSSQELYTVSVESMPQYAGGGGGSRCCKGGRVGKDLLCGVLIALAVICAAVAIFLVAFYVINGTGEEKTPVETDHHHRENDNGTLDSSPLTRNREDESKINSLNHWDTKDHLSLSSTPLPDVGIHDPEFHVEGHAVYPSYNTKQQQQEQPPPIPEPPTSSAVQEPLPHSTSSTTTTQETTTSVISSTAESILTPQEEEEEEPLVEAKSQDIELKNDTALFVPDDDVIIETPSATDSSNPATSSTTATTTTITSQEPQVVVVSTERSGGFVPVVQQSVDEDEDEQETDGQTEVPPQVVSIDSSSPVIDTAPWKPITAPVIVDPIEARFIDAVASQQDVQNVTDKSELKVSSTTTSSSSSTTISTTTLTSPPEIEDEGITEEEESTEFALTQDVGNMAMLVPEERVRTSSVSPSSTPPTTSSTTFPTLVEESAFGRQCIKRQLPFCRGVLPYSETVLPNWVGDTNEAERNLSVPYFEIIAESECHPRVQQYACAVLEPPCRANGISLPPCRSFCRAIAEDCKNYVLSALSLALVLDCEQFPQSNDPNVCLNLASTTPEGECLPGEYRCSSDNTCIPERWVCDGRQDCSQGDDEFSCSLCTDQEFKCETENRCVPQRWRCDGSKDCADGSDERDCPTNQECGDGQFRCADGLSCIPLRRVCDGSNHCRDNSDESNCTSVVCQNDDFKCRENGVCVPRQWVCDNNWDCKDGSDEEDCASETELNNSSAEVNATAVNSGSVETAFNPEKCPLGELLCISDASCIRFEQLCDGTRDCSDGADETDCSSDDE